LEVEVAALCDAATDQAGKLNILGVFDSIKTGSFPAVHSQCAVAYRLRFSMTEQGQHSLRVLLVDEDGRHVLPPLETAQEIKIPAGHDTLVRNFVLNIHGIKFPRAGRYSVDLAVDGRHEKSLPLRVVAG
jgi:hypothetical protein